MCSMTIWTNPFSDGEVFDLAFFVSTSMTKLARRKYSISPIDSSSVPFCLITKYVHKSGPGCGGDGFCELMILQDVFNSQGFNVDDLVFAYQSRRNLAEVVQPLISYFFMGNGQFFLILEIVIRTLDLAG